MEKQKKASVVVCSDRVYRGKKEDLSGAILLDKLKKAGFNTLEVIVVPDEKCEIEKVLKKLCDKDMVDLILTSGGTGLSARDVTPEATLAVLDKEIRGISEVIRIKGLDFTPNSVLSRGASGVRGKSLIINLAGSPKAAEEAFEIIAPSLNHALDVICGNVTDCGRK